MRGGVRASIRASIKLSQHPHAIPKHAIPRLARSSKTTDASNADGGGQGKLVTAWRPIAANYVKGFFWIDLISSLPYDVILLFACSDDESSGAIYSRAPKIIRVVRVVRVLRLLRVSRISKFMQKLRDLLRLNPGVVRLIQFVVTVLFVMHYNSCIFFFLGEFFLEEGVDHSSASFDPGKASWTITEFVQDTDQLVSVHDIAPWKQYVVSLYWAVTTMTVSRALPEGKERAGVGEKVDGGGG